MIDRDFLVTVMGVFVVGFIGNIFAGTFVELRAKAFNYEVEEFLEK